MSISAIEPSHFYLLWENISIYIDKNRSQLVLDKVSGYARAGHILAIMGLPNSGKSSLINVLSGQPIVPGVRFDYRTGIVSLNENRITDPRILLERSGCVEQPHELGTLVNGITVREYLIFQAMLRIKSSTSNVERYQQIDTLLETLDLRQCDQILINQLSTNDSRRVLLASCLLVNPSILLIDDLNTGLDLESTLLFLKYLKSLNKTTIVVLHQPTASMMSYIDDLCLLGRYGRSLYMGPYDRALSVFYIECPVDISPTDFFLEQAVNARPTNPVVKTLVCQAILDEQWSQVRQSQSSLSKTTFLASRFYSKNIFQQIFWLLWRSFRVREHRPIIHQWFQVFSMAFIYGLLDLGVEYTLLDQRSVQNISGLLMRMIIFVTRVCSLLFLVTSPIEHDRIRRESQDQRCYTIPIFLVSKFLIDLPITLILVTFFTIVVVLFSGLTNVIELWVILVLAVLCCTAMSSIICAVVQSDDWRFNIWMGVSNLLQISSGFFINTRSIPVVLKFLPYISIYYYAFSLSMLSQWNHINYIHCPTFHLNISTNHCSNNGSGVLLFYNIETVDQDFFWVMLVILTVIFHLTTYIALKIKLKR